MMELLQLEYFCKLTKTQHLTSTAEDLMISPSSLSSTIKKLEREVGFPLFDRVGRNIELNHSGQVFYEYINSSLKLIDTALKEVREANGSEYTLAICVSNPHVWKNIFTGFQSEYSNIRLDISVITDSMKIDTTLIDFYLGNLYDITNLGYMHHRLFDSEQYYIIMNRKNRLANRSNLELTELKNETFFTFNSKTDIDKHNHEIQMFKDAVISPKFVEGDYLTRYELLRENKCVAVTTNIGLIANFPDTKEFATIPLTTPVRCPRTQVIAWSKNIPLRENRKLFYDYMVQYCQQAESDNN